MAALAAVARSDDRLSPLAPGADDALDRRWGEVGAVREHDHGCFDVRAERLETATQRRARTALPVRAAHDASVGLDLVRAEHDDDLLDRRAAKPVEHLGHEQTLLRR